MFPISGGLRSQGWATPERTEELQRPAPVSGIHSDHLDPFLPTFATPANSSVRLAPEPYQCSYHVQPKEVLHSMHGLC